MARPKNAPAPASKKASKSETKMTSVKEGRVAKPAASAKVSKKDVAAAAASKVGKKEKGSKKAKKEPTPVSDSSSEGDDDSASSVSSDASDSEDEAASKPQQNGHSKGLNGSGASKPAPVPAAKDDSDDDSEDDSEDDSSDASEAGDVPAKAGSKVSATAANGAGAVTKSSVNTEDSDDDDDSEGSEGSDAASESDSSEDEDDDEDEKKTEAPAKKRKADDAEHATTKKAKTATENNGTKNLFVGNLTWSVDDDWLLREFSEFGECTARVMTGPDGRSKGFGFVEFTTPEQAQQAHDAKKGTELDGRPLNVDYAAPRGEPADRSQRTNQRADKFGDAKNNPCDTLWIGNISFGATAEMLQEAFEEYGTVTRVHLPTDSDTGALKGFGHIGMGSVDEAKAAFDAMNGSTLDGRPIRLDYASPRQENGGGGGGFRGGRGGGRGGRGDFGGRGGRGGFGGRGGGRGRGGAPRGRGGSFNRGGFGDFSGQKISL